MNCLRFRVSGSVNSYRIPLFKKYHKSFLIPPKTMVLGLLTNMMGESERFYYEMLSEERVRTSVVLENLDGQFKDLWRFHILKDSKKNHGINIMRRDKLLNPVYRIYLQTEDPDLLDSIERALMSPKGIPALGLDDELVIVDQVERVTMTPVEPKGIHSCCMLSTEKYKVHFDSQDQFFMLPSTNEVPLSFAVQEKEGKRTQRIPQNVKRQLEFFRCSVDLESSESAYADELHRVVFY